MYLFNSLDSLLLLFQTVLEMDIDQVEDDGDHSETFDLEREIQTLKVPNWPKWISACIGNRVSVPKEDVWIFWPVVRLRFPRLSARGFSAIFGCCAEVFETMWRRYYFQLFYYDVQPAHVLWVYNWLASNSSYAALAGYWNEAHSTFYKKVRYTLAVLYVVLREVRSSSLNALFRFYWCFALERVLILRLTLGHFSCCKIDWKPQPYHKQENVPNRGPFKDCTFVLDCTECPIATPTDDEESLLFHSGKAHRCTIKYELACHISSGRIMWISGGVSGAEHDRTVLKEGGLLNQLPDGEKGIADKGYINHLWADRIYCPIAPKTVNGEKTLTLGEDLYNTTLSSLRIEVERVFGRMKTFKDSLTPENAISSAIDFFSSSLRIHSTFGTR